jgi:hypothetical protein
MSDTVTLNIRDDAAPSDFELRPSGEPPPPSQATTHHTAWIVAILLLAAAAAGGYYAFEHGLRLDSLPWWRARTTPAAHAAVTPAPLAALGSTPEAIEVPPLDASDAIVRSLVHALSDNPEIAVWLTTNGLIRNFTVVVTNIAEGHTPARHLQTLRPASPFRTVDRGGRIEIDPRSYDRYAGIAAAITSIEPAGASRLYATLKPRIEEAHRELGTPDPSFDQTLQRAIVALLDTPSPDGPVLLPSVKGTGYAYRDARLEGLTDAQKQLLRMGPANMRTVQLKLREIAVALGILSTALPTH